MEEIENKFPSLDLHSENFESRILREGRVYVRNIKPLRGARKVEVSEVVETYMPDGTLECVNEANPGDWVIVGPEGEEFVFSEEKFNDVYVSVGDGTFLPKERKIIAIENPTNSKIRIKAPPGGQKRNQRTRMVKRTACS